LLVSGKLYYNLSTLLWHFFPVFFHCNFDLVLKFSTRCFLSYFGDACSFPSSSSVAIVSCIYPDLVFLLFLASIISFLFPW
jgi:hypothetical protein